MLVDVSALCTKIVGVGFENGGFQITLVIKREVQHGCYVTMLDSLLLEQIRGDAIVNTALLVIPSFTDRGDRCQLGA